METLSLREMVAIIKTEQAYIEGCKRVLVIGSCAWFIGLALTTCVQAKEYKDGFKGESYSQDDLDNEGYGLSNVYPVKWETSQFTKAPGLPIRPWTWNGLYFGGSIGGIELNNRFTNAANDQLSQAMFNANQVATNDNFHKTNLIYGGYTGFNYTTGAWVWSLEGELDGTGIDTTSTNQLPGSSCANSGSLGGKFFVTLASSVCGGTTTTTIQEKMELYSAIRGRLGYAFDNWLPYIAGGLSVGLFDFNGSVVSTSAVPGFNGVSLAGQVQQWDAGYNIGGGLEAAYGQIVFRGEGFYYNFGNRHLPMYSPATSMDFNTGKLDGWVLRLGISYLFHPS